MNGTEAAPVRKSLRFTGHSPDVTDTRETRVHGADKESKNSPKGSIVGEIGQSINMNSRS
jgi:hypothetical protein